MGQSVPQVMQYEKRRISWPQACKTAEWQRIDEVVDMVLEATRSWKLKETWKRGYRQCITIIVSMVAESFGVKEEGGAKQPYRGQPKSTTSERC